jgi:hypothetical protein
MEQMDHEEDMDLDIKSVCNFSKSFRLLILDFQSHVNVLKRTIINSIPKAARIFSPSPPPSPPLGFTESQLPDGTTTVKRSTRRARIPKAFPGMVPGRLLAAIQQYSRPRTPSTESLQSNEDLDSGSQEISIHISSSQFVEDTSQSPSSSPTYQQTQPNEFGLYRVYTQFPTHDPEDERTLDDFLDSPTFIQPPRSHMPSKDPPSSTDSTKPWFAPFDSATEHKYVNWWIDPLHPTKTRADANSLVRDVILDPDFNPKDFPPNFDINNSLKKLDAIDNDRNDRWCHASISLKLLHPSTPCPESEAPAVDVPVSYRDLTEVIVSAYEDPAAASYHWKGFELMWQREEGADPMRVYGETYTSPRFLKMEEEIQHLRPPGCQLETVIAPILLYSDSTKLANFGTASLWPGYLWTGALSKYDRAKPSSFSAHHFVNIPSVGH